MKTRKLIYHFAFWLLAYLFWIFIFRNGTLVLTHAITIQFCYLIFIAGNYYYNSLFTVPFLLNKKRHLLFGLCFLAGIMLGALLRVPVSYFVNRTVFNIDAASFNPIKVFLDSFINILFWVVIILSAKFITEKITAQRYIEQIEKEKADNELNFLRAQFNPHFLFNSINSIYGHIDKSNKIARDMLLVFSEMLRYQLYECNVAEIELDREIKYMQNYIALQKTRIDERITVDFNSDDVKAGAKIAPLILIIFIENAFKYVGFNEGADNSIKITLNHYNDSLCFSIFNTRDTYINTTEKASGLGIANAKRRLELLYPNRHELQVIEGGNDYLVNLTLQNV